VNTSHVLGTGLSVVYISTHVICTTTAGGRKCFHSADDDTEAQRGYVSSPLSPNWQVAEQHLIPSG
jgi:hypothetical protein